MHDVARRAPARLLAALCLVVATAACSGDDGASTATTTTIEIPVETTTTTEVPIEDGDVIYTYDPEVGDCFDLRRLDPASATARSRLDIVLLIDCGLPHRYEVFDVIAYDNIYGIYPGDHGLQTYANQNCARNFDAYVGQAYELSEIEMSYWAPSDEDWSSGPQRFACTLYDPVAGLTVGSLAGSAR